MFGIEKRIARLGESLSDAFNNRARHYFTMQTSDAKHKSNAMLIGAVLAEIGTVIKDVTKVESERTDND